MWSRSRPFCRKRSARAPDVGRAQRAARKRLTAPLAAKLALAALSLALVLAALEVATRLFSRVAPPLLCNDPLLGMTFIPGYRGSVFVPECGREVYLRFDRDGMRGPDLPYDKPAGVRRVAVLGDSMIAAIATDEQKTLVRRLEERLNAAQPQVRWQVLNFGISGSSTGQELVVYRELVRKYQPDVVVCAFCVLNDLGDNCSRLTSNGSRIYFDLDGDGELVQLPLVPGRARLTSWLNQHSRLYVWQKGITQRAINAVRNGANELAAQGGIERAPLESGGLGIFCTEPSETLAHAWLVTKKLIDALRDDVWRDGGEFVLAVLPTGWQVCDDAWQTVVESAAGAPMDPRYPDERLSEIGRDAGATVALMTEQFRAAAPHHSLDHDDEWLHYNGIDHFNDRGNEVAAEVICDAIMHALESAGREPCCDD